MAHGHIYDDDVRHAVLGGTQLNLESLLSQLEEELNAQGPNVLERTTPTTKRSAASKPEPEEKQPIQTEGKKKLKKRRLFRRGDDATPTPTKKPAPAPKRTTSTGSMIQLADVAEELGVEAYDIRKWLRKQAVAKPNSGRWEFQEGSATLEKIRKQFGN